MVLLKASKVFSELDEVYADFLHDTSYSFDSFVMQWEHEAGHHPTLLRWVGEWVAYYNLSTEAYFCEFKPSQNNHDILFLFNTRVVIPDHSSADIGSISEQVLEY